MEAEIIFSGLCSFLNVRNANPTMTEPSVILVRTEGVRIDTRNIDKELAGLDDEPPTPDEHIPYIAFQTAEVNVEVLEGGALFKNVPKAPGFEFLRLDGVELKIADDPPAMPTVLDSYDLVVKKDDYWPAARNLWNRDFVPEPAQPGQPFNQPKKSAVVGFMRFGSGTIAAGKMARVEWSFPRPGQDPHRGRFAEEVVYSRAVPDQQPVVIQLTDLESGEARIKLRFSAKDPAATKLTLFVGNNDVGDIDNAVQRRIPASVPDNEHFLFLNQVAAVADEGPIPSVVRSRLFSPFSSERVGGHSSGPCGPNSSNG